MEFASHDAERQARRGLEQRQKELYRHDWLWHLKQKSAQQRAGRTHVSLAAAVDALEERDRAALGATLKRVAQLHDQRRVTIHSQVRARSRVPLLHMTSALLHKAWEGGHVELEQLM